MFKENTLDNWILGGTVFILIFTIGCYLYFQNEMTHLKPENVDQNIERQHLDESSENEQIGTHRTDIDDTEQLNSFKNIRSDDYSQITSEVKSTHQGNFEKIGENTKINQDGRSFS